MLLFEPTVGNSWLLSWQSTEQAYNIIIVTSIFFLYPGGVAFLLIGVIIVIDILLRSSHYSVHILEEPLIILFDYEILLLLG